MRSFFSTIDDLLRGRLTRREDLAAGRIDVPVGTLALAGLLLGATYGVTMGLFAPLRSVNPSWLQLFATAAKVPLLFILTLVVTYPSLYVVSAMFDSKLRHRETLRLLLAAMGANLALLASLGPVTAFFTLCTDSYAFMVVLNVLFFTLAGAVGLGFLQRALNAVFEVDASARTGAAASAAVAPSEGARGGAKDGDGDADDGDADGNDSPNGGGEPAVGGARPEWPMPMASPAGERPLPAKPASGQAGRRVFSIWIVIYSVVGAQMGWVLRPFVGAPDLPFELFREERESNFFAAVLEALAKLVQ